MKEIDKQAIPSYIVFIIALTLLFVSASKAFSQDYKIVKSGNNFTKEYVKTSSSDTLSGFTYTIKDTVYPVYITKNGRCYIIRTSKKSGKDYKQYLDKEICLEICKALNVEYKE